MTTDPQIEIARLKFTICEQATEINRLRDEIDRLLGWINGDSDALTCLQTYLAVGFPATERRTAQTDGQRDRVGAAMAQQQPARDLMKRFPESVAPTPKNSLAARIPLSPRKFYE